MYVKGSYSIPFCQTRFSNFSAMRCAGPMVGSLSPLGDGYLIFQREGLSTIGSYNFGSSKTWFLQVWMNGDCDQSVKFKYNFVDFTNINTFAPPGWCREYGTLW